jgi:hypothetical protein
MGFVVVVLMGVSMGLTLKIKLEPSNYFDHNMLNPDLIVVGGVMVAGCSCRSSPQIFVHVPGLVVLLTCYLGLAYARGLCYLDL